MDEGERSSDRNGCIRLRGQMITSQPPNTGAQAGHDPVSGAVFPTSFDGTQRSRFDSGNLGAGIYGGV